MSVSWLWMVFGLVVVCSGTERSGGSLRGALEALQRRQRGRFQIPQALPDYDALYEYLPPQAFQESDYGAEIEEPDEDPAPKYIIKFLDAQRHPPENYEYKVIKKKNLHIAQDTVGGKESAFRERSRHSDNDRLRELFTDRTDATDDKPSQEKVQNDAEYAMLLGQLWSKYKNHRRIPNDIEVPTQGIVKLYKEKNIKKRVSDNWGPIAFKKKRSPESNGDADGPHFDDYQSSKSLKQNLEDDSLFDPNYNQQDIDKNDFQDEYTIAFQPLEDEPISDFPNDNSYSYDLIEKRFPVSKRSSGPFVVPNKTQKKRYIEERKSKHKSYKNFRSSSGTDPRVIKDLSKIFGESDNQDYKTHVKRNSNHDESSHEIKPPQTTLHPVNATHGHNISKSNDDNSHEQHGHSIHHPGMSGPEEEHVNQQFSPQDKAIKIRKKSIDWSKYFGIDKRMKKSTTNNLVQDRIRKQYIDNFSNEVVFRKHDQVKRNYDKGENEETEIHINSARALALQNIDKQESSKDNDSKLDDIDKKLKSMESMIVDEALHYSNIGEELDSKEEQEIKEKLLSRLAAAYSLEKMRKAMKEFKQSLKIQKPEDMPPEIEAEKSKRIAIKKEKADISENVIPTFIKNNKNLEDFEEEQGAGHYRNGKIEEKYTNRYVGGSGRHHVPIISMVGGDGSCPVLERIVQRCRGVDLLAGDRGQLFLPLCSLHQICNLCGEASPTTCDLVFLSEADSACEGDSACQRAARSALMALRELHDGIADELDGECEASPCLPATLKLNINWQRALQR